MDLKKAKLALGIAWLVIGILAIVNGAAILQLSPLVLYLVLAYLDYFKNKNVSVWMTVLAILMIVINLGISSIIDVVLWALALAVYFPRKKAGKKS